MENLVDKSAKGNSGAVSLDLQVLAQELYAKANPGLAPSITKAKIEEMSISGAQPLKKLQKKKDKEGKAAPLT